MQLNNSDIALTQVYNNSASGNRYNAIYLSGNNLTGSSVLNANIPYVLSNNTIPAGAQLNILAGAVVKLSSSTLTNNGALVSQGTATNPVYITSFKDDSIGGHTNGDGSATLPAPGDWQQIVLANGTSATFDHTTIRYGGYYDYGYYPCISAPYNSTVTLRYLEVSFSRGQGISMNSTSTAYTEPHD